MVGAGGSGFTRNTGEIEDDTCEVLVRTACEALPGAAKYTRIAITLRAGCGKKGATAISLHTGRASLPKLRANVLNLHAGFVCVVRALRSGCCAIGAWTYCGADMVRCDWAIASRAT